jgi:hypothetical protein
MPSRAAVIPAKAGIQFSMGAGLFRLELDSRFRRNDAVNGMGFEREPQRIWGRVELGRSSQSHDVIPDT